MELKWRLGALSLTAPPSRGDDKTVQAKRLSDIAVSFKVGSEPKDHLDVWDFFRAYVYAEMAHKVLPQIRERDGRHGIIEAAGEKTAHGTRRHKCVGAPWASNVLKVDFKIVSENLTAIRNEPEEEDHSNCFAAGSQHGQFETAVDQKKIR